MTKPVINQTGGKILPQGRVSNIHEQSITVPMTYDNFIDIFVVIINPIQL